MTIVLAERVWLEAALGRTQGGDYQLSGDYGQEPITVVLSPGLIQRLSFKGREEAILAMRHRIEEAATKQMEREGAHRYFRGASRRECLLVVLTGDELWPAQLQ